MKTSVPLGDQELCDMLLNSKMVVACVDRSGHMQFGSLDDAIEEDGLIDLDFDRYSYPELSCICEHFHKLIQTARAQEPDPEDWLQKHRQWVEHMNRLESMLSEAMQIRDRKSEGNADDQEEGDASAHTD